MAEHKPVACQTLDTVVYTDACIRPGVHRYRLLHTINTAVVRAYHERYGVLTCCGIAVRWVDRIRHNTISEAPFIVHCSRSYRRAVGKLEQISAQALHAVVHGKLRIRLRIYVYITAVGLHAARCGGHRKCDRISSGSCIPVFRICRLRGGAVTKIPLVAEAAA